MKTIKNRNRNGRPAMGVAEKRDYKVSVRMSTEEYYSLKAKAGEAKITPSEYIRELVAHSEVRQRISPEQYITIRQLTGMGNNLNQLARRANAAGHRREAYDYSVMAGLIDRIIMFISNGR